MPTYTYICEQCHTRFEAFASIKQKISGWQPACPQCGSDQIRQIFESLAVISKSEPLVSSGGSCCSVPRRK